MENEYWRRKNGKNMADIIGIADNLLLKYRSKTDIDPSLN